jgi:hypothetical protein
MEQSSNSGALEKNWPRRWALQCGALLAATVVAALVVMFVPEGEGWLAALPRRLALTALIVLAWPACIGLVALPLDVPLSPVMQATAFVLLALAQWGIVWGVGAGVRRLKLDLWYGPVLVIWVTVGILLTVLFSLAGR